MDRIPMWLLSILFFLVFPMSNSEDGSVKQSLVQFMTELSAGNARIDQNWGWNMSSDPCNDKWFGVTCDSQSQTARMIVLNNQNFTGTLDASSVCMAKSLAVLSLESNGISGLIPEEIRNCRRLTHLYVRGNQFTGDIPDSLSQLNNLKRLDVSNNNFSGELPDLPKISGLLSFWAQQNQFSGPIPDFHFSNLKDFNVANNNFSGPIPDVKGKFSADRFSGNAYLCGEPLPNACPPLSPLPSKAKPKHSIKDRFLIYSGYILLSPLVVLLIALTLVRKFKAKERKTGVAKTGTVVANSNTKPSSSSNEIKNGNSRSRSQNRSEYSITSVESGMASSSLVVLGSPVSKGLRFEDLLRAPAELLGRGKHGSLYKVLLGDGVILAVKRIKGWGISCEDFRKRMQRLDQVRHPRVLPAAAFYSSDKEKLLVYQYQPNGSLFNLLYRSQSGQTFDWESRLNVAATIVEALTFMHQNLRHNGIAHGNLKSTKILLSKDMEPCMSEYGLMVVEKQDQTFLCQSDSFKRKALSGDTGVYSTFKVDVYAFGVILLELLTGKQVQNNGFDLARWVRAAVREEWTTEIFDKALISEGASEKRMVNLLRVALKCIHPSPNERPCISQIAVMINSINEEEERSISSDP